ncbi:MAG TPA: M20 family metallopeptidase [Pseudonocardiaceae bacterium]
MGAELARLRRDLHREPETGLHLPRTQERVLGALDGLPLEISTGASLSSVTAVLRGTAPGDAAPVLLRGDMDALPVAEASGEEFAATNGAMHACGHDLHTAGLVGAARLLCARRGALAGDVVFMFQPGEEGHNGAGAMIDEGVLDAAGRRVEHAYGLHVNANAVPHGLVTGTHGPAMAGSYTLDVTVRGTGGHGSRPAFATDPLAAAAEMVGALRPAVARRVEPFEPVVVTVGLFQAGTAVNVIPDVATFRATVRMFDPALEPVLRQAFAESLRGIATAHRVEVDFELRERYPALINTSSEVDFVARVAPAVLGEERFALEAHPVMGSEDFSRVLDAVPGAFLRLGACPVDADPAKAPSNHASTARFDDTVLPLGAALLAGLAIDRLAA